MTEAPPTIEVTRCDTCQLRYLPNDGPCPKCGGKVTAVEPVPGIGTILVATELVYPAAGWTAPHRLALVEVAEGVRLLAIIEGRLPVTGESVKVRRDGDVYRATAAPTGRGEGESPKGGRSAPSFEPPR